MALGRRMASILPAQRSRIAFRQAGMVVIIAFILGAIVSTVQIVLDYNDQGLRLTGNLDRLIQSVERPAANALWELNETLGAGLINGLLGYGPVVSARLETVSGDTLAAGTRAIPDDTLRAMTGWMFAHERHRSVPLLFRDGETLHRVGTLSMQIDPGPMIGVFLSRAAVILLSGVVRSLAFALVLFAVFYYSLTRPLTALSRIDAGQMPVTSEPFDAGRLLRDVAEQLRPVVARNGNALDVETESIEIHSDPQKLGQILRNLIGNAAKFTHGGTVAASLKRDPEDPEMLRIDVADTGIGIDPDTLGTIFNPFVQGDDGLSKRYEGSGLGLAIVRELCALLDVSIDVESEPGQGSRFSLRVPARTVRVAASA